MNRPSEGEGCSGRSSKTRARNYDCTIFVHQCASAPAFTAPTATALDPDSELGASDARWSQGSANSPSEVHRETSC